MVVLLSQSFCQRFSPTALKPALIAEWLLGWFVDGCHGPAFHQKHCLICFVHGMQAQPASAALGPTLYESGEKNAQELQDIIAARGKGLPDLVDVPAATVQ